MRDDVPDIPDTVPEHLTTSAVEASFAAADCEETVHRLYNYLDGELTEERRRAIRAHLDECGPCVDVLGFEAELRRVIADRCKERVPEQLIERISRSISHEQLSAGGSGE